MPVPFVLLAEDNADHVELVLRAVRKLSVAEKVVTVSDGEEAIEFLTATGRYTDRNLKELPRFVVLDLKMPKKTGLEVLAAIRQQPETRALPVIMFTTSKEERDITTSYDLGVNSYIQKPVDFRVFTEVVQDLYRYWSERNQPGPTL